MVHIVYTLKMDQSETTCNRHFDYGGTCPWVSAILTPPPTPHLYKMRQFQQLPVSDFLLRMSRHGTDETSRDDSVHNSTNVQQKYTRFLPETSVVNNPNRSSLRTKTTI